MNERPLPVHPKRSPHTRQRCAALASIGLAACVVLGIALALGCGDGTRATDGAAADPTSANASTDASTNGSPNDSGSPPSGGDGRHRVFLIGIDGASPRVVVPMMRTGRLPNLARLAHEGAYGPILSEHPLYSPRIWNSIATGKDPEEHGITAFVHKDEQDRKHLYLSSDRKVPALWNILSSAGRSVGIVNWWTTYPPEVINGVMVSDHFFPQQSALIRNTFEDVNEMTGARVYPASWSEIAEAARIDTKPLVTVQDPFAEPHGLASWTNTALLSDYWRSDTEVVRTALAVEEAISPDVLIVFLPGIDRVSHWLWGNLEPAEKYPKQLQPTDSERQAGASALFTYYEFTDQLIGRVLRTADADDLVIVLSDHGFEAQVSMMLLTGGHETGESIHGVFYARGPGVAAGGSPGEVSVLDVTPTVLAWLGIPPAADMKGRPMTFIDIDVPEAIASYDALKIERIDIGESGAEDAMVENLRALGYLEGDGVDDGPAGGADPESGDGADGGDAVPVP